MWPIRLGDKEDTIGVRGSEGLGQTPDEMSRIDQPGDIQDDHVTQRERHKYGDEETLIPIGQGGVDGQ